MKGVKPYRTEVGLRFILLLKIQNVLYGSKERLDFKV